MPISVHETRLWRVLCGGRLMTTSEIAKESGVAFRTAQKHLPRFHAQGLIDRFDVHPGPQWRVRPTLDDHARKYANEIEAVGKLFEGKRP